MSDLSRDSLIAMPKGWLDDMANIIKRKNDLPMGIGLSTDDMLLQAELIGGGESDLELIQGTLDIEQTTQSYTIDCNGKKPLFAFANRKGRENGRVLTLMSENMALCLNTSGSAVVRTFMIRQGSTGSITVAMDASTNQFAQFGETSVTFKGYGAIYLQGEYDYWIVAQKK